MKKIVFVVLLFAGVNTFAQSKVYFNTEMAVDFIDNQIYIAPNVNMTLNNHCIGLGISAWVHDQLFDDSGLSFPGGYIFYQYKISRKKMDYFFQYNFGYNAKRFIYYRNLFSGEVFDTGLFNKFRNHVGVGINWHFIPKLYINTSFNYGVITNLFLYDNHPEVNYTHNNYGGFVRIGIGYSFRK